jgi:hypothetical protein
MAFEAYFLIHPFFYDKDTKKFNSMIKIVDELKKNITALTPNFNFEKLIGYIKDIGLK